MDSWEGTRDVCCLDIFGYSGSISNQWSKQGCVSVKYDIRLNPRSDDILGKRGFLHLVRDLFVVKVIDNSGNLIRSYFIIFHHPSAVDFVLRCV